MRKHGVQLHFQRHDQKKISSEQNIVDDISMILGFLPVAAVDLMSVMNNGAHSLMEGIHNVAVGCFLQWCYNILQTILEGAQHNQTNMIQEKYGFWKVHTIEHIEAKWEASLFS